MPFLRLLLPVAGLVAATACDLADAESSRPESVELASAEATRVVVANAQARDVALEMSLPGEVIGARDATLASALGGYVESVDVRPGDSVRKGQTIARIDTEIYAANRDSASARLDLARSELDRQQRMGDLASLAQVERADVDVRVAEASLRQARAQLARAYVRAPFAGVVGDTFIDPGEVAVPGAPVARLVQIDKVRVTLSVADRDVVALREGMPVKVSASAHAGIFDGVIRHVGAAADLRTRAFPVEVEVDNDAGTLLPGMIARVDVAAPIGVNAVVVPQDWVVTRLDGAGVFLESDGVAVWRGVDLGDVVHDEVVVKAGLVDGDRVIVTGHRELIDGDPVLVARVEGPPR